MGNPILERARLHFKPDELRKLNDVPEWGESPDAPLVLFAKPVTMADKKLLSNRYKDGGLQEMYAHALILKATHADGRPAFSLADKRDLMTGSDPAVVERIAQQILAVADLEDVAKN